jgi:hypothetical protein
MQVQYEKRITEECVQEERDSSDKNNTTVMDKWRCNNMNNH